MVGANQGSNRCQSLLLKILLLLNCIWSDLLCSVIEFFKYKCRVPFFQCFTESPHFLSSASDPLHRSLHFGGLFYLGLSFQGCCALIRGQGGFDCELFFSGVKGLVVVLVFAIHSDVNFLNICQQIEVHVTCWFCLFGTFIRRGRRVCLMWFWTFPFSKHVELCMGGLGLRFSAGICFSDICGGRCLVWWPEL